MDRYKLEKRITIDLEWAAEWAQKNDEEFTRDDIDQVAEESIDSALIYTRDILELWDDFGNPEPTELSDTLHASVLFAVHEAIYESDVIANAAIEAGLEDVYTA